MPRRLPWLVGEQSASTSTPPRPRRTAKITPLRAKPVRQPRKDNGDGDGDVTTERSPTKINPRGEGWPSFLPMSFV